MPNSKNFLSSIIPIILIFCIFQILPVSYEQVKKNKNTNTFQGRVIAVNLRKEFPIEIVHNENDSIKIILHPSLLMIQLYNNFDEI